MQINKDTYLQLCPRLNHVERVAEKTGASSRNAPQKEFLNPCRCVYLLLLPLLLGSSSLVAAAACADAGGGAGAGLVLVVGRRRGRWWWHNYLALYLQLGTLLAAHGVSVYV